MPDPEEHVRHRHAIEAGKTVTGWHTIPEHDLSGIEARLAELESVALADGIMLTDHERRIQALEQAPGPEPTPEPEPDEPPFLSRPKQSLRTVDGGTDVELVGFTVIGGSVTTPVGIGITVRNVRNLRIANVDLANLIGGIYLYNISGRLEIENVRSRNIGDGTIGSGHSNHLQLAESSVEGYIRGCRFLGGRTEDMLSIYHSGGIDDSRHLWITLNALQGLVADTATARAWNSGSGTGIIVGDGAGSPKNGYVTVGQNTLLTPGQVGIQIIDGKGLRVGENVIYGEKRPQSNNPMTTWEGTPVGFATANRYYWLNPSGGTVSPWKHPGGSGMAFTGNVQDASIDPATLRVVL